MTVGTGGRPRSAAGGVAGLLVALSLAAALIAPAGADAAEKATQCSGANDAVTAANVDLQKRFAAVGAPVRLLSITVDPEYDTPPVLKAYAEENGADLATWTFATGDRAVLEALVMGKDGFRLAMGDKTEDAAGVADITHSTKLVLVDRKGQVRHYFSSSPDERELVAAYAIDLLTNDDEGGR